MKKINAGLNGEWKNHVRKIGKKITAGIRRAWDKRIIRRDLNDI